MGTSLAGEAAAIPAVMTASTTEDIGMSKVAS
jgi:hypothetical protein